MLLEEILPHLNKIARLYLVNNKRRVGWLFMNSAGDETGEIYFVNIMKGSKMLETPYEKDIEKLKNTMEKIQLSDILGIRSIE